MGIRNAVNLIIEAGIPDFLGNKTSANKKAAMRSITISTEFSAAGCLHILG